MSDDWAKALANKITPGDDLVKLDHRAVLLARWSEEARLRASELLFKLFTDQVDAVGRELSKANRSGGLLSFLRRPQSPLTYQVKSDISFRLQTREAYGTRLEITYQQGSEPTLKIDVATQEVINGQYCPIFRESGAVAGAQIWQEKQTLGTHPDLIARLWLLLSTTAIEEGLSIDNSVIWVYADDQQPFTKSAVQTILEKLITAA